MNAALESSHRADAAARLPMAGSWIAPIVLGLVVGTFFAYWASARSLINLWLGTDSSTYTHGFLIAGVSLWLVARRRHTLRLIALYPSLTAGTALIATGLLWLIAVRAGIQLAYLMLLPVLMLLTVNTLLGRRITQQLIFPTAFLLFAVPAWGAITPLLQSMTVAVVGLLLHATTIPAYVEGNFVHLAAGTFEVASGCSGVRYVIVGTALACLYGELGNDSLKSRIQLIALATFCALAANWLRVYVIVVAGYLTDMQHYLVRVSHHNFGWAVFAVMMGIFFFIARRFPQAQPDIEISIAPTADQQHVKSWLQFVCLVCVLAIPVFSWLRPVRAAPLSPPSELLPASPGAWTLSAKPADWTPTFVGADQQVAGTYVDSANQSVQLYVASYAWQAQGKELIGYYDSLINTTGEEVISRSHVERDGRLTELLVRTTQRQALIWYSYKIGTLQTDNDLAAQLWYGIASVASAPVSQVIAMRSECVPDCKRARSRMEDFIASRPSNDTEHGR